MMFLYRHSIELYLKSLIIIFHKKLKVPYGSESFDSKTPKILTNGKWKELYTCHWIEQLYTYWLNELLLKHAVILKSQAPQGDWNEVESFLEFFRLIAGYDRDSSFFRYPITKNKSLDSHKYTMQRVDLEKLDDIFLNRIHERKEREGARMFTLFKNSENEIVDGFERKQDILDNLQNALNEVANYFHGFHVMTRVTLCGGF